MTGSLDVDVNASDEDAIGRAAEGDGGSDASHAPSRQWRSSRCAHFSRGVRARRGGAAVAVAGSDSELARAGAVDAVGRCEEDVDVSAETGCADDGMLVGAGVHNARGGSLAAAAEGRAGACAGDVPETEGPSEVADGSMSAETDAEGERPCLWYVSSRPDVTRTTVSEMGDVDSTESVG